MSRKSLVAVAVAACLALVFAAIPAAERDRDTADRSKQGPLSRATVDQPDAIPYYPQFDPTGGVSVADPGEDAPPDISDILTNFAAGNAGAAVNTANQMLWLAGQQEDQQALDTLQGVLALKLGTAPERNGILAETHLRIADLLQAPNRKTYHLQQALWHTEDPEARGELEDRIRSLGGVPSPGYNEPGSSFSPRDFGDDDQCFNAEAVGIPSTTPMSIDDPFVLPGFIIEDRNFVRFDIPLLEPNNPFDPLIGAVVKIETAPGDADGDGVPDCTTEAECSDAAFDTAMNLYRLCSEDGVPDLRVAFDEGPGDAGLGFFAMIDGRGTCFDVNGKSTGQSCFVDRDCQQSQGGTQSQAFCQNVLCLPSGSYFAEIKGDFGNAPKDFKVEITQLGTCEVPRGDNFEVDDKRPEAVKIGFPSSIPSQANGVFGRAHKEIQQRTVTVDPQPVGQTVDTDHVKVVLSRDELVRFTTAVTHPTSQNGRFSRPAGPGQDTQLRILYRDEPNGGICNHNSSRTGGSFISLSCRVDPSANEFDPILGRNVQGLGPDLDGKCFDITPANQAVFGFGPRFIPGPTNWCIPVWHPSVFFLGEGSTSNRDNFKRLDGVDETYWSPPITLNDNVDAAGQDFGSKIELCVPRSGALDRSVYGGLRDNELVAEVTTSQRNQRRSILNYFYEVRGQNLAPCTFEREPNQAPFDASPLAMDSEGFGVYDIADTKQTNRIVCLDISILFGFAPGCDLPLVLPGFVNDPFFGQPCPGGECGNQGFYDFDWWGPFDIAAADVNQDAGACFGNLGLACAAGADCVGVCETDFCDNGSCDRGGNLCFEDADCASTCANAPSIVCDDEMGMPSDDLCSFGACMKGAEVGFRLNPQAIDPQGDSELDLWVGPDAMGSFRRVASEGTGSGACWLGCADVEGNEPNSALDFLVLPPAADLLAAAGVDASDPKYYLVAYGDGTEGDAGSHIPNWFYRVSARVVRPIPETEPNESCIDNPEAATVGSKFTGTLSPACDGDAYRLTLTDNTFMNIRTDGDPDIIDTAVQVENCDTEEVLACDDDGQNDINGSFLSIVTGCLAPGDYCVRVRSFAGFDLGDEPYTIIFEGTPGCDPGPLTGDFAFTCDETHPAGGFDSRCNRLFPGQFPTTICGVEQ